MSQSATPVHVGRDVSLYSTVGEPVEAITVWLWNTTPLSARLLLAADEFERVRSAGLFNSDELDTPAAFSPVDSCLLDLEVVDTSLPTDTPTIKKRFADPDSALRSTDAWTATKVRDHESTTSEDAPAADAPRVSDVGLSIQQSEPAADPDGASTADETVYEGLTDVLARVAADLAAENRPFEPSEDGISLSLTATADQATWQVIVEDLTGDDIPDDAKGDSPCRIRSIYPDCLGEAGRTVLEPELDAYTETLNRGGFVVGSAGTGPTDIGAAVEFWTPFDPQAESTSDALTENVTALAEWFDRLAAHTS